MLGRFLLVLLFFFGSPRYLWSARREEYRGCDYRGAYHYKDHEYGEQEYDLLHVFGRLDDADAFVGLGDLSEFGCLSSDFDDGVFGSSICRDGELRAIVVGSVSRNFEWRTWLDCYVSFPLIVSVGSPANEHYRDFLDGQIR